LKVCEQSMRMCERCNESAVLAELFVSLACRVRRGGAVSWWLTRESGEAPPCVMGTQCECSLVADAATLCRMDVRGAYLVVNGGCSCGDWEEVAFSVLSTDRFDITQRKIIPFLRDGGGAGQDDCCGVVRDIFYRIGNGGFGGTWLSCRCDVQTVCQLCTETKKRETKFVWCNRYIGVFPRGDNFWFTGVSDAVGCVRGIVWKQCAFLGLAGKGANIT
jgi:hypothetical protein